MNEHANHHVSSLTEYFAIFAALMVLTAVTVWVAFQDFSPFNDLIAMTIAVTKGTLVVLYFMHVKYSSKLTWVFAGAGFFWLFILFGLTLSDYVSREWVIITISRFLEG